eukprot:UN17563
MKEHNRRHYNHQPFSRIATVPSGKSNPSAPIHAHSNRKARKPIYHFIKIYLNIQPFSHGVNNLNECGERQANDYDLDDSQITLLRKEQPAECHLDEWVEITVHWKNASEEVIFYD